MEQTNIIKQSFIIDAIHDTMQCDLQRIIEKKNVCGEAWPRLGKVHDEYPPTFFIDHKLIINNNRR